MTCQFRWLSTAYMTWALMGVSHPGARGDGWAWVRLPERNTHPSDAAVSATRLAHVSIGTDRSELQQDIATSAAPHEAAASAKARPDSAVVANAMAEFVGRTLKQLAGDDAAASSSGSENSGEGGAGAWRGSDTQPLTGAHALATAPCHLSLCAAFACIASHSVSHRVGACTVCDRAVAHQHGCDDSKSAAMALETLD